ncbi:PREDICTED: LOW QUALITY PROTEIN: calcium-dependent phospholipase A2-like [Phaethon lepturus]|uniref:LOW QUALITY PROTEIN: calcium-dependent phospholipase A2-like n=1 Tax=Phaethon lepturus TaxID=97097 RepID=UPI0005306DCE|nr:PREDICTED: LOW QUALITY PROTEIN: calcium-dependent phospholipase A2-like [Phaethon lepturus]
MKVPLTLAVLFACSVFTARGKLPRTFTPGLGGRTVGNLSAHGCYSGWGGSGTGKATMDRLFQRGACRCERAARLCRMRGRALLRRRSKCRGRAGRC